MSAAAFLVATGAALVSVVLWTSASATASTRITEPAGDPYHVALDAQGKALPVTIVATGFQPGTQVFAEECNGRAPSEPRWSPTLDCDDGAAPAPAIADASGTARFSATDHNRLFVPFVGASPSNLFNCVAPHGAPPANSLTNYTTCQIRVSTNNVQATDDQVFHPIVLGSGGSGGGSSGGSGTAVAVGVIVVLVVLGGVIGTVFWLRRRRPTAVHSG